MRIINQFHANEHAAKFSHTPKGTLFILCCFWFMLIFRAGASCVINRIVSENKQTGLQTVKIVNLLYLIIGF